MKRKKINSLVLNKKKVANLKVTNQIVGAFGNSKAPCPEPDTYGTCAPTGDTICQSAFPFNCG